VALFAKQIEATLDYEPCSPDLLIEDGLDLSDFGFAARLLHTPGHSRGSISVIVDNEMALVGDLMYGAFPRTIFPPYADDIPQMVSSWGRLLGTPCSLFMPGHGSPRDRKQVQKAYAGRIRVSS
jgi:glyoxylase-like metal-dependent hydrolase (beta-lactamase superfamily II)